MIEWLETFGHPRYATSWDLLQHSNLAKKEA